MGGFGLEVDIKVENVSEELLRAGHEVTVFGAEFEAITDSVHFAGMPLQSCAEAWCCRKRIESLDLLERKMVLVSLKFSLKVLRRHADQSVHKIKQARPALNRFVYIQRIAPPLFL